MRGAWAVAIACMELAGCVTRSATPLTSDERRARTGLDRGDAVALLVAEPGAAAGELEDRMQGCLESGLTDTEVRRPAEAASLRAALDGEEGAGALLRSREALERARASGARYLLVARADTREGGFPTGGAAGPGWMIGRYAQRVTEMRVDVLDLRNARRAGRVLSKAYGPSGRGVFFFFYVLPIPLIEDAQTEAAACQALARRLDRFLEDPRPHGWLPEPGEP